MPPTVEFDLYEEPETPYDFPTYPPSPPTPPLQPLDDLAWYSPNPSPDSQSSLTADLPWALDPEPLPEAPKCSFKEAFKLWPEKSIDALDKEMAKYFVQYKVCDLTKPVRYSDIPATALKQRQILLMQPRFLASGDLKKIAARCATQGQHQPPDTYTSLYAGACDTVAKFIMLAAYHARALDRQQDLKVKAFDVPGAFLQAKLTPENSPQPCYIKMPDDIPHPCAGKWYLRTSGTYGSKDANALFDADLIATLASAHFFPNPEEPKLFTRHHPTDPSLSATVSMHVDDGLICSTHPPFVAELKTVLDARYGDMEWHDDATDNTGFTIRRYTDGSVDIGMKGHIARMSIALGMTNLPYRATPSDADLFDDPTDTTPVPVSHYRHLIGNLNYIAPVLPKAKKEIQFLSTRQAAPTQSDLTKVIKLLAYIYHHQDEAVIRFSGADHHVHVHADASYAAHPDGRSHTGYYLSIGKDSGAVRSYSAKQTHCVADGSMHAEYVVLAQAGKEALHYRRMLHAMGFAQTQPVTIYEDNESAINLAQAPAVTRKSQHIHVRYHLIRDMVKQKLARLHHVSTTDQPADLLTKALPPHLHHAFGNRLHNVSLTPLRILNPQSALGVGGSVGVQQ